MRIGVPTEVAAGERRVALVPEGVGRLVRSDLEVVVQRGAGALAFFTDAAYEEAGATLADAAEDVFGQADLIAKVARPTPEEVSLLRSGAYLVSLLQPASSPELVAQMADAGVTAFSLELIPRIARAQSMDVLSSQSSLSGYKAALIAATSMGKFLPMMMTAAGTIPPARVLIMGTGVAGLQAIATARRLGAVVQGYDIRPAAKEQVESLGATFVSPQVSEGTETTGGYAKELSEDAQERERQIVHGIVAASDVVITTALIPGRPAPRLVPASMVAGMQPGSVIVDIAAEMGGNCELTEPGATVVRHEVTIHGPLNVPSSMPVHASQLYSRNIFNLLQHLVHDGQVTLDFEDVITRDCCVTHGGEIRHAPTRDLVAAASAQQAGVTPSV